MSQTALPTALPFGLRDVKLSPLVGGTPGTSVDLPNARTFSFSEAEDTETLRGDDGVVAIHGKGPVVDWSLESGGISYEALKVINGGTITTTGTTPATKKTYNKKSTDTRPYFQAEGQAISDSGGDFHVKVYRCRATGNITGSLADTAFWLTGCSGQGLPATSDSSLYDFVQNETAVAIT